jgi:hypothetical protein
LIFFHFFSKLNQSQQAQVGLELDVDLDHVTRTQLFLRDLIRNAQSLQQKQHGGGVRGNGSNNATTITPRNASRSVCPICKAPCSALNLIPLYIRQSSDDANVHDHVHDRFHGHVHDHVHEHGSTRRNILTHEDDTTGMIGSTSERQEQEQDTIDVDIIDPQTVVAAEREGPVPAESLVYPQSLDDYLKHQQQREPES